MPVSDPAQYRDKREDWLREFRARRIAALRPLITPTLLEEHRANPRGPHSADLQLVLNFVRGPAAPIEGKAFAYQREPYADYGIGTMTVRGAPTAIVPGQDFATEREAQHAAFLHRLVTQGLYAAEGGTTHV